MSEGPCDTIFTNGCSSELAAGSLDSTRTAELANGLQGDTKGRGPQHVSVPMAVVFGNAASIDGKVSNLWGIV